MPSSSGQPGQGKKIGHRGVDASGETTYKKVLYTAHRVDAMHCLALQMQSVFSCFEVFHSLYVPLPLLPPLQTTSSALKGAIQLGIGYTVGNLSSKPERDVLMQDFYVVESIFFPRLVL